MNALESVFENKKRKLLSVYFTAGYPNLDDTTTLIKNLEQSEVDFLEVGFPFSDPLADGPTIQKCSQKAIKNGMTLPYLLSALEEIKSEIQIPIVLMGYLNPILQMGVPEFLSAIKNCGVSGMIVPDMPLDFYEAEMMDFCHQNEISNILLITPETSEERILEMDRKTSGFIYVVSSNSITGVKEKSDGKDVYFKRVNALGLKNPLITGFGIHDAASYQQAVHYSSGGIIGSAFINHITENGTSLASVQTFIKNIKS